MRQVHASPENVKQTLTTLESTGGWLCNGKYIGQNLFDARNSGLGG